MLVQNNSNRNNPYSSANSAATNQMKGNLTCINDNNKISLKNQRKRSIEQKSFMLCASCFWCASSYLNAYKSNIASKCPNCQKSTIELLPICENEIYASDYDSKKAFNYNLLASRW
jgi:predicted Zn-ribbon and HTH transcriptional regulator